jgi:hypothetical protein
MIRRSKRSQNPAHISALSIYGFPLRIGIWFWYRKMNQAELDVGGHCHKSIWDNLAEQYNEITGMSDCIHGDTAYWMSFKPRMCFIIWWAWKARCGSFCATHQPRINTKSLTNWFLATMHARFKDRVGECLPVVLPQHDHSNRSWEFRVSNEGRVEYWCLRKHLYPVLFRVRHLSHQ